LTIHNALVPSFSGNDGTMKEDGVSIGVSGMSLSGAKGCSKDDEDKHGAEGTIVLEDIETLNVLGEGSSGMVQKILHKPSSRFMALKVVPLEVSSQQRKQILLEVKTLGSINCPQIVSFYGAILQENAISMALEYMEAGSLHDVMKHCKKQAIEEVVLGKMAKEVRRD
jgi:serine/threonine protein kinase